MKRKTLSALFILIISIGLSQKDSSLNWEYGFYGAYSGGFYKSTSYIKYTFSQQANAGLYLQRNTKYIGLRVFTALGMLDFNLKNYNNNPFDYTGDSTFGHAQSIDLHNLEDVKDYRLYSETERGRVYQKFNYLNLNLGVGIVFFRNLNLSPVVELSLSYFKLLNYKGLETHNYNPEVQLYQHYAPSIIYDSSKMYGYDKDVTLLSGHFGLQYAKKRFVFALIVDARFLRAAEPVTYMNNYQNYTYYAISNIPTGLSAVHYKSIFLRLSYSLGKKSKM